MYKLVLTAVITVVLGLSHAQARTLPFGELLLARNSDRYDLDSAVSRARKRSGGRVLSAETREREGQRSHDVRVITEDGRVRRLRIHPETGDFIAPRRDRGRD